MWFMWLGVWRNLLKNRIRFNLFLTILTSVTILSCHHQARLKSARRLSLALPANMLSIRPVERSFTNFTFQVTPASTNYYVWLNGGYTNLSGMANLVCYNGNCMELSWKSTTTNLYLIQQSDGDLFHWQDIHVWFVGNGSNITWLDDGLATARYFRLKLQ